MMREDPRFRRGSGGAQGTDGGLGRRALWRRGSQRTPREAEGEEQQECGRQSGEAEGGHVHGEEPALRKNREEVMNPH